MAGPMHSRVDRFPADRQAGISHIDVASTELLPIAHSWPMWEWERHFEDGRIVDFSPAGPGFRRSGSEALYGTIGRWQCKLAGNALTWSSQVYDLFGFPRGALLDRDETVARYCEHSRVKMERLRAYAIRHRRGFTLDAQIVTTGNYLRWMRLIAAPVCDDGRVVGLHGVKLIA
jgi:PAS domain-containing protein